MDNYKDTQADEEIKKCINNCENFSVVAGAGSGKTTSLIKALVYIQKKYGDKLRASTQKIACITYTNAAVKVIMNRTNLDDLFLVSTIHSFLWELIKRYQKDICDTLEYKLIPQRIAKKEQEDNGGQSAIAIQAREYISKYTQDLKNIHSVEHFFYNDNNNRNYSNGQLNHEDIIDLATLMINNFSIIRKIIGQQYPFILIDEAQDTFISVIESFNLIAQEEGLPIIGYFGDPMQQIYDDRAGEFNGPQNAVSITKLENYRCSKEVIKLLNKLRPELQQIPGPKNVTGSVEIRLIKSEVGQGQRNAYSEDQILRASNQFNQAQEYFGWSDKKEIKKLFLTWQMIAQRLGFAKLNKLFTGIYASEAAQDSFKKGNHFALQPFIDVLIPLVEANSNNDYFTITKILRENSPLLDPKGASEFSSIKDLEIKVKKSIKELVDIWDKASIKQILEVAQSNMLITMPDHLAQHIERHPREETYNDLQHRQEKEDWLIDEFLTFQSIELLPYRNFIIESTPFGTQHGVKGEEYEKVLVVFDDIEANWNNFSFSRVFTPNTTGKGPTDGQKKRCHNLAYVCFSRAIQDLRIVFFTIDPIKAKKELIDNGLFLDSQISIQSN